MKILLVGDLHGNERSIRNVYAHACRVNADRIIQLGDFGFGWVSGSQGDTWSKIVSSLATQTEIPLYWLDGNHENHDLLNGWQADHAPEPDGTFQMEPGVFYIPRGTMLDLDGCKVLVCGGAQSVDQHNRTPYVSWWPQESIKPEDVAKCAQQGRADILLTHDAPLGTELEGYLNDSTYWPRDLLNLSYDNRRNVWKILKACRAKHQWTGHLHLKWDGQLPNGVHVTVLDQATSAINECTQLIDTADYQGENR
jgi:predicted phosphodiesterase